MPCEKSNYVRLYENKLNLELTEFKKEFVAAQNIFRENYSQILQKSISKKFQASLELGNTHIDNISCMVDTKSREISSAYKIEMLKKELEGLVKINKHISERLNGNKL